MAKPSTSLQRWFAGDRTSLLQYPEFWKVLLIRIADRATDKVDEEGKSLPSGRTAPYSFDLLLLTELDLIRFEKRDLLRAALHFEENGWGKITRRAPPKLQLTKAGLQKANELAGEIFDKAAPREAPISGFKNDLEEDLAEWILLHGWRAREDDAAWQNGMINFRVIADRFPRPVPDGELETALTELEFNQLIARDSGPTPGKFWAYFNYSGEKAADLLERLAATNTAFPASDRFVRIDDNRPEYAEAILDLENLIGQMREIRVNDWPEKEGMMATISGTLEMVRAKFVNKTALLAGVSSVVTFIMLKFAEAPIADVANRAWNALKNLF